MNISFDVFNQYPKLKNSLSTDEHIFYTEYINFFAEKLAPLKDEIDAEENSDENGARFTEINILNKTCPANFWGYSNELKSKMRRCFENEDFKKFEANLVNAQQAFHN